MLKVTLDPSGLYVATSCADKTILLFDVSSGECISRHSGHSGLWKGEEEGHIFARMERGGGRGRDSWFTVHVGDHRAFFQVKTELDF